MSTLTYKPHALIEDLGEDECTVHRSAGHGARWWTLWALVRRSDNGKLQVIAVPINPRGGYLEKGPGGRTWGLVEIDAGEWQVSPSIRETEERGSPPVEVEIWHQTPTIVGVPAGEPWQ